MNYGDIRAQSIDESQTNNTKKYCCKKEKEEFFGSKLEIGSKRDIFMNYGDIPNAKLVTAEIVYLYLCT